MAFLQRSLEAVTQHWRGSEGRMKACISLLEVVISGSWSGWNIGFIGGGLGVSGERGPQRIG